MEQAVIASFPGQLEGRFCEYWKFPVSPQDSGDLVQIESIDAGKDIPLALAGIEELAAPMTIAPPLI